MHILRHRPLATATLIAIAATVFSFFLDAKGKVLLFIPMCMLGIVSVLILLLCKRYGRYGRSRSFWLVSALTCLAAATTLFASLYHFHLKTHISPAVVDDDMSHAAEFLIEEEGSAGVGYSYFTVSLRSIDGRQVKGKATLECSYAATYHTGDVLHATVQLQSTESYYSMDNLYYAISDGICVVLLQTGEAEAQIIGHEPMPLLRFFSDLCDELSSRLLSLLGKNKGGLAAALFLGERDLLNPRVSTNFRRTGTSHLLALSGMHITILMGMIATLSVKIGLPKRARLILLAILLLGYLALIGFRLPAVRAVGMLLLFYIAQMLGTRHDPLTTLCVIGWGMLSTMPAAVVDGGFWMSFSAVFGLITILPKFNDWLDSRRVSRKISRLAQGIAASSIAVISVSFCTWLFCGEIAPIGIVLTAVLSPLLGWILILIPPLLLLDMIPCFSATPLVPFLSTPLRWMLSLTSHVSEFRNISFSLRAPYVGATIALMSMILLVMLVMSLRRKWLLLIPPVLASVFVLAFSFLWQEVQFGEQIRLNYLTQSSGSVLTVADKEGCAIIDTSAGTYSLLRDAEKLLTEQGATELEHLILTHYHRAYTYSIERLAKQNMLRYLWVPMPQNDTEYLCLQALYERLTPLGTAIRCYGEGEQITLFNSAVFSVADCSYIERSSQPILTYLLQTPNEILTSTSPVVRETDYYPTFRWIYDQTDILILSAHGPKIREKSGLIDSDAHPALVLTNIEDLGSALFLLPKSAYAFSMNK